ncbi:hypothetical protein KRM28CT15_35620 [Krasilnikovia sp. M28-CT-15]
MRAGSAVGRLVGWGTRSFSRHGSAACRAALPLPAGRSGRADSGRVAAVVPGDIGGGSLEHKHPRTPYAMCASAHRPLNTTNPKKEATATPETWR